MMLAPSTTRARATLRPGVLHNQWKSDKMAPTTSALNPVPRIVLPHRVQVQIRTSARSSLMPSCTKAKILVSDRFSISSRRELIANPQVRCSLSGLRSVQTVPSKFFVVFNLSDVQGTGSVNFIRLTYASCNSTFVNQDNTTMTYCRSDWVSLRPRL